MFASEQANIVARALSKIFARHHGYECFLKQSLGECLRRINHAAC
jgi:hypothetical protein